jgi:uncharacterized protein (UPF0332 family)
VTLERDLLQQAHHLARREPRKPRQASLRRAISAAYYALFHLLVAEASRRLVRGEDREALRQCLRRAFSHEAMKSASQGFRGMSPSPKLAPALGRQGLPRNLARVADAFLALQQARHEADYDTGRRFSRQEALDFVQLSGHAFDDWTSVRGTLQADTYLVALLALKQIRS